MNNLTDERDGLIIEMLRADPTVQNSQISTALGVSNATIGARIKKLQTGGIVRVVGSTDIRAAGYETFAMGSIQVAAENPNACINAAAALAKMPQIVSIGTQLHQHQIMFHMIGQDPTDIERTLVAAASANPDILDAQVSVVLSNYKYSLNHGPIVEKKPDFNRRLSELSATRLSDCYGKRELSVLAMLHGDGRKSLREVARHLDFPESQVRAIFRKLDDTPGMLNYKTIVNPGALGHRHVHQIYLKANYQFLPAIVKQLTEMPEVLGIANTSAALNLAVSTITPSRIAFRELITERIPAIHGIENFEVVEMMQGFKFEGSWTIPINEIP